MTALILNYKDCEVLEEALAFLRDSINEPVRRHDLNERLKIIKAKKRLLR